MVWRRVRVLAVVSSLATVVAFRAEISSSSHHYNRIRTSAAVSTTSAVLRLSAPAAADVMATDDGDRTSRGWASSLPLDSVAEEEEEEEEGFYEEEALVSPVSIKVVGVGGGGGNAVDGMITTATRKLSGVEFVAMNTDTQALTKSHAEVKIALGSKVTRGLGAGGKPEVGLAAATESLPEIEKTLAGADLVFVTAGMGGGTGTGAAPVIASAAKGMGCVTVAVVTEPFGFEGRQRSRQAAAGLAELREAADTVLVVANDKLLEIVPGRMTMKDAFLVADDVLRQGVIGTSELIVRPGLINVDFADVRQVITNSGTALIGIGMGSGKTRAEDAAVGAIVSPLLEFSIDQAAGVIFNIVGGADMSLTEVNAAASIIQRNVHPDANIIIGALVDERCGKEVSVTVLATGFKGPPVLTPTKGRGPQDHSTRAR
ncbi:plastid division protein FtsZ [Ectocarpus siliculosus]|uniref:Plastid division protein FtsZ n=1 Tax=Ectocarpus siliculosus TaxID=2880 RepID=D7FW93_ECTSI|nr:plastid division protein FtsZ [Ectocarpus siliculosus]|eukprot:CBJ25613.1 plastid division protein FtsZ [Ectocarpus siliculosus]